VLWRWRMRGVGALVKVTLLSAVCLLWGAPFALAGADLEPVSSDAEVGSFSHKGGERGEGAGESSSRRAAPKEWWGRDDADLAPDDISAYGSVSVGERDFGADFTLALGYGPYEEILFGAYYRTESFEQGQSTVYGPEFGVRYKLPNPSIITPWVGGGVGVEFWRRWADGVEFDRDRSLTGHAALGVNVRVTRSFTILLGQRWVYYFQRSPQRFEDHATTEEPLVVRPQIGFIINF
jgi:hypothetical protein